MRIVLRMEWILQFVLLILIRIFYGMQEQIIRYIW